MSLYFYRWPDGDFSVVQAKSKPEAILLLDEVGAASGKHLFRMNDFMIHFRLRLGREGGRGAADFKFEGFGQDTFDFLSSRLPKPVPLKKPETAVDLMSEKSAIVERIFRELDSNTADAGTAK